MNNIRLWHSLRDEPIIASLMDVDFYKFTMGQFIFNHFPTVKVCFAFKNRTKNVSLTAVIPIEELRRELDHVMTLRASNSELHYLRGTNEYGERMFAEPYLQFLKGLRLPQYELRYDGDEIILDFTGLWSEVTYWETIALSIVNELYFRHRLKGMSRFEIDAIYAEGIKRLHEKVKILKAHPKVIFSDFTTRRRFKGIWHDYLVTVLCEELPPEQFRGTSNTFLAMKHGIMPMGTNAHELQMVIAGLMSDTDENLLKSQDRMLDLWWKQYGEALSIFLPDTFGTTSFLRLLDPEKARKWKGFRLDSGDPFQEGEEIIRYYNHHDIDAGQKMLIPSDGLELQKMISLTGRFKDMIGSISHGWGSNLGNDLGLGNLSIVVKAVEANGIPLVKLSNNPAKAMGDPEAIKRYMRVFGYGEHAWTDCTY